MTRIKRGVAAHARHKRVLALTKGMRATKHSLYRRAHEAMLKKLSYAYRHRRERKRDMRRIWIARINAAARLNGFTYSRLMAGLRVANIAVDRKVLAELAVNEPTAFTRFVELARDAAGTPAPVAAGA